MASNPSWEERFKQCSAATSNAQGLSFMWLKGFISIRRPLINYMQGLAREKPMFALKLDQ